MIHPKMLDWCNKSDIPNFSGVVGVAGTWAVVAHTSSRSIKVSISSSSLRSKNVNFLFSLEKSSKYFGSKSLEEIACQVLDEFLDTLKTDRRLIPYIREQLAKKENK